MEGGIKGDSYHRNSVLQARGFKDVQDLIQQAVVSSALLLDSSLDVIRIADLGCASGSNTLNAMDFVAGEIIASRKRSSCPPVEIQAAFSDITGNDFNALFSLVPHLQGEPYFFSGIPGSFYGRLFPRSSIHFAMTSYALHYLSKVPEAVMDKNSAAWNKDALFVDRSSPPAAIQAVMKQADDDLRKFLQCRGQELATGGILFMVFPVRLTQQLMESELIFQTAWKDLIDEGLLSQESLDTFNFPAYLRSIDEVKAALKSVEQDFKVTYQQNLVFPRFESPNKAMDRMKHWKAVSKRFVLQHIGDEQLVELMYDRMLSSKVIPPAADLDLILLILVKT